MLCGDASFGTHTHSHTCRHVLMLTLLYSVLSFVGLVSLSLSLFIYLRRNGFLSHFDLAPPLPPSCPAGMQPPSSSSKSVQAVEVKAKAKAAPPTTKSQKRWAILKSALLQSNHNTTDDSAASDVSVHRTNGFDFL